MDAVLNWLLQGAVVAAASFVMLLALDRARANVRYMVCWVALLAVAALPALASIQLTAVPADALRPTQAAPMVSLPDAWWTSRIGLLAAWIVWACFQTVRLIAAVAAIRRARVDSRPFPSHVESGLSHWMCVRATGRHATLVVSDAVASAAVLGWGAPMIAVAPSMLNTLETDELDRVLIHEWAHVQRRDDLTNIVQVVVRAIVGWHPALRSIDRRLQVEREIACDETTIAMTGSPKAYAECLMKLADLGAGRQSMRASTALLTSSGLRARIIKIVSAHRSIAPLWSRSIAAGIVAALGLLSMQLGGLKLVEATVLELPIVASRTVSTRVPRTTPIAAPLLSSGIETPRPGRTLSPVPTVQRPRREHVSAKPDTAARNAVTLDSVPRPSSTVPAEVQPESPLLPVVATLSEIPAEHRVTPVEKPRAPWAAAADGGTAIGRKSKDAGIATAGFFSRFARRVAGSF